MMIRIRVVLLVLLATAGLAAQTSDRLLRAGQNEPHNWLTYSGDYASRRFSALDQITPSNVAKLGGAWSLHLEEGLRGGQLGNLDATPIVEAGARSTILWPRT